MTPPRWVLADWDRRYAQFDAGLRRDRWRPVWLAVWCGVFGVGADWPTLRTLAVFWCVVAMGCEVVRLAGARQYHRLRHRHFPKD